MGKRYARRQWVNGPTRPDLPPPRGGGFPALASSVGLGVILSIFIILATLHSLFVPISQGEDELAHYRYLSFIAQTGRLPATAAERDRAWYRADWPPLYHLLVGWAVSPLDTSRPPLKDVGESPRRRLVGEIFYPRLIIYTEDARWPWRDGILAWHLGRFISILFSAGALVFVYLTTLALSRRAGEQRNSGDSSISPLPLYPPAPWLALAVTALLAFTPRFVFTSAMLGDDSLLILLSAGFIWLLLRGDGRWWIYALMGLLLGLSIATKYSTGLLLLAIMPVVWRQARLNGWRWTQAAGRVLVSCLFTLVGAGWWFGWIGYHFNTIKQDGLFFGLLSPVLAAGPDVSMRRLFAFLGGASFTGLERPDAVAAGTWWDWLVYLFQTCWGVPVLEFDPLFPWAYIGVFLFCLAALPGLWRLWTTAESMTRMTLGVLALIIMLLLPFPLLRFFLTHNVLETGQGRHILYPAAQAIPILLMAGWMVLLGQMANKDRRIARPLTLHPSSLIPHSSSFIPHPSSLILHPSSLIPHPSSLIPHPSSFIPIISLLPALLLLAWSIFQLIYMARTYPDPLPVQTTTFDPAAIPQPLRHRFGDSIQLLGYDFRPDPDRAIIDLTLYWESLQAVDENYRTRLQLLDPAGRPHLTWLSHPVNGLVPSRAWDQGDVIRDEISLPLAAVAPAHYRLQLDLLHEAADLPLTAEPLSFIEFDLPGRPPIPTPATLAGVGYRLWGGEQPLRQRQTVALSFARQTQTAPATDQPELPAWTLLGPDGLPRPPAALGEATAVFMIGADWPSGDYRLQLAQNGSDPIQTGPQLVVANQARRFSLPEEVETRWTPVEATFTDPAGQPQLELLGYELPARRIEPGGGLPLTLYWQSLAPVLGDTLTFAVLLDAERRPHGSVDRYPNGYYSPMLWAEGEIVVDELTVPASPNAPPGVYALHLGQYRLVEGRPESLPLLDDGAVTASTAIVIEPIKVGGPPPGVTTMTPHPQVVVNQSLGGQITLLGYDLTAPSLPSPRAASNLH
ncbi:MAG: hypothetical protein AB1801_11960, partial [Chloroflexota bacterium]